MINSRLLLDLSTPVLRICNKHIELCKEAGIDVIICSTYRDYEEQNYLYSLGRTVFPDGPETKRVTDAKAGESWHNFRCAWDAIPLIHGKADWNAQDPVFQKMIALGIQAGAESGQKFPIKDYDHFQVRPIVNGAPITEQEAKIRFDRSGTIFTL